MGVVADLLVKISADSSDLRKELHASQRQIKSAFGSEAVNSSQKSLSYLKYLTAGLAGAGIAAIKFAADMEQTKMAFETLLGSSSEAEKMVKNLTDFAARTPFQMPGITKATQQLLAYGFSAESIIPMLTSVGDAVSGLGGTEEDMQSVIRALGQIQAKGKVSAEEMNQLAEKGINGWKYLAEAAGVSISEIQEFARKGALNSTASIQAILNGMGNQFQGGMEKQSQTINGLLSTIQDNTIGAARVIGNSLADAFDFKGILKDADAFLTDFTRLAENSGVGSAIKELVPDSVKLSVMALASAYTARLVPALYLSATAAMAANAAMLPLVGTLGAVLFTLGLIYTEYKGITDLKHAPEEWLPKGYNGTGLREHLRQNKKAEEYTDSGVEERKYADSVTDDEIRRLKERNSLERTATTIKTNNLAIIDKEAAAKKEMDKAAKKAAKAAEAARKKQEREYKQLLEKAKDTSDRITDEWIQMTGTKMDVLDKWRTDEIATLNETKSVNTNYQQDLTRLEETYSEKRRKILHDEAKEKQRTYQEITQGVADIQSDLTGGGLKGSAADLFDMSSQAADDLRSVTDFFSRIGSEYSDATQAHKQDLIEALDAAGVAYRVTAEGNLDFQSSINYYELERFKQLQDEKTRYFKQNKDIQSDIDEAYISGSLSRLKEVLNKENTIRLSYLSAQKSTMDLYYESLQKANISVYEQTVNIFDDMRGDIKTLFSDLLNGTKSFGDAVLDFFESLGSNIVDSFADKWSNQIVNGLMGIFDSGEKSNDGLLSSGVSLIGGSLFSGGFNMGSSDDNGDGIFSSMSQLSSSFLGLDTAVKSNTGFMGSMGSAVLGGTGLLGKYNIIQGLLNMTTKPAEATTAVTATTALAVMTAAAYSASAALSSVGATSFLGGLFGFASGGAVRGPGTSVSDSIPAMLSNGEFVLNAKSVRKIGISNLTAMNEGRRIPFAEGGYVTGPTLAMVGEGKYNDSVTQDGSSTYRKIADGINEQAQPAAEMRPIVVNLSAMDAKSLDTWLEDTGGRSLEKYFKRRGREFAMLGGIA